MDARQAETKILENILLTLPTIHAQHAPGTPRYALLKQAARQEVERLFAEDGPQQAVFGPFGTLVFPYHRMGAVDSLNLFDIDELILFSFYWTNRGRYQRVVDAGANLGLHSILLDKCGFTVRAFEPDPTHFSLLTRNLALNDCRQVEPHNAAVSTKPGSMEFVRVLGNTTGSHLAGAKQNPYGDLERFDVPVHPFAPLLAWADLVKMDIEGHEREVLLATGRDDWESTDALVEVENADNAAALYEHFTALSVNCFSQKNNWLRVHDVEQMPTSYREGSLFISTKEAMPWEVTA
ncbi:MAG: FkbM family methyltransferase [Armatimonadota bacterium]